jgi:hypothetical protein
MSGHGSSGRWHFPVNAFMEQVFARSSFSAPASFSYCSVGFPMPAGKNPVSASAYFC